VGIIIGSKTGWSATAQGAQRKVFRTSTNRSSGDRYRAGWYKDPSNGKTYCPKCRWPK